MNIILLIFLMGNSSQSFDRADIIEVNHYYADGEYERETFTQVIYWQWSEDYRRHNVMGWLMFSGGEAVQHHRGHCIHRGVKANIYRETWTTTDPERENLMLFPEAQRRKPRWTP